MAMHSFDHLLQTLPECDKFPMSDPLPPGIGHIDQRIPMFVPASLSDVESVDPSTPAQVLIVSAPGAVGKSTLAKELAFRKGALLWDLASAPEVGSGSLNGTLFGALAKGNTDDFLEYLREGLQFIIVDALDEGRTKVNENSFRRLLEDIGQLARHSKETCFVLFGRTNIAETSWLTLAEQQVSVSMISIVPFRRDQANEYIDNKVDYEKRTPPYYACRDLIFEQLAFSVTDDPHSDSAEEFLHYPPVLDVVATLLRDEPNLYQLENTLTNQLVEVQDNSIHLLQNVIARILEREQEKVLPAIRKSLDERAAQIGWSDWSSLYSNEEQCKRLLASVFDRKLPVIPTTLPGDLQSFYEDSGAIASSLPEHPFLQGVDTFANKVFESYLYARALLNHFGHEAKDLVTQELLNQEHLSTRLLAAFYLAGGGTPSDSERAILPNTLASYTTPWSARSPIGVWSD